MDVTQSVDLPTNMQGIMSALGVSTPGTWSGDDVEWRCFEVATTWSDDRDFVVRWKPVVDKDARDRPPRKASRIMESVAHKATTISIALNVPRRRSTIESSRHSLVCHNTARLLYQ
jgi:hypothetical protein